MGKECNMDSEADCRVKRSVYQSECQICLTEQDRKTVYIGTTGRVQHCRNLEHQQQIRTKSTSNALSKHHWSEHQNQIPSYKTTILRGGFRYNLDRQICESLTIETMNSDENINLINQRSEWGGRGIPRLQVN